MATMVGQPALASLLATLLLGAVVGPPKKPYRDRPEDRPRAHVETITEARHEYRIEFRGTVDGTMTRDPIGYAAFHQGWQPNRSVLIENIGNTDVCNPWLVVGGRRDWRTLEAVVAEATRGCRSAADKARAIWEFIRRRRFHACTWDGECNDPIKVLNVYGYTLCGNQAVVLDRLWRAAGLRTRRCFPIGHVVGEVYYDGAYHMMDSDEHIICLLRDNRTIASAEQMVRDHDLIKRTHAYGIGHAESRRTDEFSASLYVYEGKRGARFGSSGVHRMDLTLRPGESLELRWDHVGKQYTAGRPLKKGQAKRDGLGDLLAGWGQQAYDNMRNGKLRYRPPLKEPVCRRGALSVENAEFAVGRWCIVPADSSRPARVGWQFSSPYVFVGGRAEVTVQLGDGATAQWRWSADGQRWKALASAEGPGRRRLTATLDQLLSPRGRPMYRFQMQLILQGEAAASNILFDNDIQTSALSLPELEVGENRIVYTDQSAGPRRVRITHRWVERTAWHPPSAPPQAVFPADGQTVDGSRFTFRWSPPSDPDGDPIVDYHFELSEHADMRWPLSPNFERLTSRTPAKGAAEWTIPYLGLLNPNTDYYWHVRAKDATGVWGPWSRTFRFRLRAPGVPIALRLVPAPKGGFTLTWQPNPQGTRPVAYKVYGSDEKGFTASDQAYTVFRGKGFVQSMDEYQRKSGGPETGLVKTPGNLIARVSATRLRVIGPDLTLPNVNRAFYRVVAVDGAGRESGPSDYAAAPRPLVYTEPPAAKAGQQYVYEPGVIRSIGDLRCRRSRTSSYNAAFWDREELSFTAERLPEGLKMDWRTGRISGRPRRAGTFELAFTVRDQFGHEKVVRQKLKVTGP